MKTIKAILYTYAVLFTPFICETHAQTINETHFVGKRDADSRTWLKVTTTQDAKGQTHSRTNLAYIELATGMHYWEDNQWKESKEIIEPFPDGAIARYGQHKVIFANNLNTVGAIDLQASDGKELRSHVLGLSYYDSASGNSVLIAQVKDCQGQIVGSNQVIYADAFEGASADVRYTYMRAGFEQDIILRAQPPSPKVYGLNPETTRLQVLTEFLNPPQPAIISRQQSTRAGVILSDNDLNFGVMKIAHGRAFLLGTEMQESETTVSKSWMTVENRQVLVEEVPVIELADELKQLPALSDATKAKPHSSLGIVSAKRLLPQPLVKVKSKSMQVARVMAPHQGLVLDYNMVNGTLTDYTFQGDTTYYISGFAYLYGTTTLEGGAVIKYANSGPLTFYPTGPALSIQNAVQINCLAGGYHPVIFTAKDDDSVGMMINGSTGIPVNYYGNPALTFYHIRPEATLSDFRILWASQAISANDSALNFYDGQIVNCLRGITAGYVGINLRNMLFAHVRTNFNNMTSVTVDAQNVTFSDSEWLASVIQNGSLSFENCIVANMQLINGANQTTIAGTHNGFYGSSSFGSSVFSIAANPFQASGAGSYYLKDNSPFRDVGMTSIDTALLNSLKTRTTFSPVVYANTTISSDDFNSQVQRDTYAPDLGYHYDALDYVFENCQVNSSMTFPAGTAVGWQGQGLSFSAGYSINFNGTAASPCYFVRVNTVQEADSSGDGTGMTDSNGNGWPSMNAVFTRFSALGNTAAFFNANSFYVSAYNCEFWNGLLGGNVTGGLQLYCYNCLFDRSFIGFETTINSPYGYLYLWNCTLHGGTLSMDNLSNNAYHNVYDSAFDGTTLEADGVYGDAAYNAYLSGADTLPNDHDDVTVPGSFNWQDGLFGSFYLPSASPLIDAGTYSASSISDWTGYTSTTLATFTTQTSEAPEGDTTVDIGYHYPALLAWAGNQPLCPNGTLHLNNYNSNPDVFGSPLTYSVVSSPAHGSLSGTPSDLIYTPDSCYEGDDSFTYKISDGLLTSPPATVTLTMADQATAYPPSVQTCRDTTSDQFTLGGSDNCGETLTYSILSNPTHGYLTLIGSPTDPVYTYTPNNPSGYTGTDSFEYQVANGCGNSDTATVTITVGDANLCPNNQTAMTGVNQAINLTLTANDNDSCKDDPLTYTITANPLHGSVTPSSGTGAVQYTPATDYEGIDTFTFTVSDGTWNAQCSDAQVTIFVVKGPTLTTFCRPDRIVLNWSLDSVVQNMEDNYTDGFYIQDFKVYRATSPGGPYTLISSPSIDTRTYVDTDVTPNQNYCYIVTFEYYDYNTGNTYPASAPAASVAPYSNESCSSTCSTPPYVGRMDIAFIVDNTGSMSDAPLTQLKNRIANVLDTIEAASGNDYRLALVTPDDDQVDVMLSFSINNRSAFVTALNAVTDPPNNGDGTPESTDECLNTVLNALSAANRQNPRECSPPSSPLQYNNFTPGFRTNVLKLVVMITDHEPGGFCDNGDNGYQAGIYAQQARDNCVHINAVQVGNNRDATPVMQNYYQTSCGWHEQVGYDGIGIADDVVRMFYVSGYCNCQ